MTCPQAFVGNLWVWLVYLWGKIKCKKGDKNACVKSAAPYNATPLRRETSTPSETRTTQRVK